MSALGDLFNRWMLNLKRLFHLLIALAFLLLAAMGASVTYSEWVGYRKTPEEGLVHFALFAGFTVFLSILCLYSFAKAKSVR